MNERTSNEATKAASADHRMAKVYAERCDSSFHSRRNPETGNQGRRDDRRIVEPRRAVERSSAN
jgi:hypothetical protein